MVGCIGQCPRACASRAFCSSLLSLSGRCILLNPFIIRRWSGNAMATERSRRNGKRRSPSSTPPVRIVTSKSAILIAYGVGARSVLPPDEVAAAGLSEKGATGRYLAKVHIRHLFPKVSTLWQAQMVSLHRLRHAFELQSR